MKRARSAAADAFMGVPRTLFHGTLARNLPSILEKGVLAGSEKRANFEGFEDDVAGCVFLAEREQDARFFGLISTTGKHKKPGEVGDFVVLIIDSLKVMLGGVPVVRPQGKLEGMGQQFVACGDVPREAVVAYIRSRWDPNAQRKSRGKTKVWEEWWSVVIDSETGAALTKKLMERAGGGKWAPVPEEASA